MIDRYLDLFEKKCGDQCELGDGYHVAHEGDALVLRDFDCEPLLWLYKDDEQIVAEWGPGYTEHGASAIRNFDERTGLFLLEMNLSDL